MVVDTGLTLREWLQSPYPRVVLEAVRPFRIKYVNEAWSSLVGYSAEECAGQTLQLLQGECSSPATFRVLAEAFAKSNSSTVKMVGYTKLGVPFLHQLTFSPLSTDFYLGQSMTLSPQELQQVIKRSRANNRSRRPTTASRSLACPGSPPSPSQTGPNMEGILKLQHDYFAAPGGGKLQNNAQRQPEPCARTSGNTLSSNTLSRPWCSAIASRCPAGRTPFSVGTLTYIHSVAQEQTQEQTSTPPSSSQCTAASCLSAAASPASSSTASPNSSTGPSPTHTPRALPAVCGSKVVKEPAAPSSSSAPLSAPHSHPELPAEASGQHKNRGSTTVSPSLLSQALTESRYVHRQCSTHTQSSSEACGASFDCHGPVEAPAVGVEQAFGGPIGGNDRHGMDCRQAGERRGSEGSTSTGTSTSSSWPMRAADGLWKAGVQQPPPEVAAGDAHLSSCGLLHEVSLFDAEDVRELVAHMQGPEGLPVRGRPGYVHNSLQLYFAGSEAVTWMVTHLATSRWQIDTRQRAVAVGRALHDHGALLPLATPTHEEQERADMYRFEDCPWRMYRWQAASHAEASLERDHMADRWLSGPPPECLPWRHLAGGVDWQVVLSGNHTPSPRLTPTASPDLSPHESPSPSPQAARRLCLHLPPTTAQPVPLGKPAIPSNIPLGKIPRSWSIL